MRARARRWVGAALLVGALYGCNQILGIEQGEPFAGGGGSSGNTGGEGGVAGGAGGQECVPEATQQCYDGPAATEDVGICHGGTQTCSEQGSWGACEGQQLPENEDCAAAGDEDCDGLPCSEHIWSKMAGFAGSDQALGMATDGAGNIVIVGGFTSTQINLGGASLSNLGSSDIFVAMYSPSGSHLWSTSFGQAGDDHGAAVAFDSSGDVIVTGQCADSATHGAIAFGGTAGNASCNGDDTFIAKLAAADGSAQWVRVIGGATADARTPLALALDSGDKIIIGGDFDGSLVGCAGSATAVDAYLKKFSADGVTVNWTKCYGGAGIDQVRSIAVDAYDNVVFGGQFSAEIVLDQTWISPQNELYGYVAKVTGTDGSPDWSWSFGATGTSEQSVNGVAVDASGAVVVVGQVVGALDVTGSSTIPALGSQWDMFAAKYTAGGTHQWSEVFDDDPGDAKQHAESVAVDGDDNIVVTGAFLGTVDPGGGDISAVGGEDVFVIKVDAAGAYLWSKHFGSGSLDMGESVAVNGADQVAIAGYASGGIDFGSGSVLPYSADHDIFVALFHP